MDDNKTQGEVAEETKDAPKSALDVATDSLMQLLGSNGHRHEAEAFIRSLLPAMEDVSREAHEKHMAELKAQAESAKSTVEQALGETQAPPAKVDEETSPELPGKTEPAQGG
jgi:hypothetical protein